MTGDEHRELAALWGEAIPPADQRELELLARRTPRLARMIQWAELAVGFVLGGLIVASVLWRLGPATAVTGGVLLVLLVWSTWKRHRLGRLAILIDNRDRLSFVETSVRAKEAELKRSALGLVLVPPGIVITTLLIYALRSPAGDGGFLAFLAAAAASPRGLISCGLLICAVHILGASHLRLRAELGELRRLRQDYRDEAARDHLPDR